MQRWWVLGEMGVGDGLGLVVELVVGMMEAVGVVVVWVV